jgi:4-diphosphocytidyl-2-C-methyl-D-erythritol kinase
VRQKDLDGVAVDEDLTVRAALALQAECASGWGADIWVDKRLPAGGGLGGGSSDAATVLLALNRLWGANLGRERLASLALQLGADVPVFVRGFSAWAQGIGEVLEPLPAQLVESKWYLVVDPGVTISTGQVFGDPGLTRNTLPVKICDLHADEVRNDCEPVVRAHWPEVGAALQWLDTYGKARMSGTGACCFVAFATQGEAQEALGLLPEKWRGFVSQGTLRSRLEDELTEYERSNRQ